MHGKRRVAEADVCSPPTKWPSEYAQPSVARITSTYLFPKGRLIVHQALSHRARSARAGYSTLLQPQEELSKG
jgi:hypothetical protein